MFVLCSLSAIDVQSKCWWIDETNLPAWVGLSTELSHAVDNGTYQGSFQVVSLWRRSSKFSFHDIYSANHGKCGEMWIGIDFLFTCVRRSEQIILILFWYVDGVTGLTFYGSAVSAGNRNITLIRRRFECKRDSLLNVIDKSAKCHAGVVSEDVPEVESENWIV